ncbi:hypothetical protein D3A96_01735 [Robertkochia marina]|nr:hypothetical protein D3A96_01735 [Robertkochia marina]
MTFLMLLTLTATMAQQRVKERDVLGTWELKVDIQQAIKEETKNMNLFEGMMARAFSGMAEEVMEEIDITFDFRKNNVLYLTVHTDLGEDETDVEELYWEINKHGQLIIEDIDNDNVQVNNDGYWMKSEGRLVAIDKDGSLEPLAWMQRVK